MSKQAEDFQKINGIFNGVIMKALGNAMHHDVEFKKYALQTNAWDGVEELEKIVSSLSDPFLGHVKVCLEKCAEARKQMPDINISYENEFPVASASIMELSQNLDEIRESRPELAEGVPEDKLVSAKMFVNLAEVLQNL